MKHLVTVLALAAAAGTAFTSAHAATAASKPLTAQQQKMGDCAKQNKGKKGAEYKAAMKSCLSGGAASAAAPAPKTQKEKMAECAKQNKGKKGADYKSSMKACLGN